MTIYHYCLNYVKQLEVDQQLEYEQARQIYEELIKCVQCAHMNLGVARKGARDLITEVSRHNRKVEMALAVLRSGKAVEISFKGKGQKKPVILKSQIHKRVTNGEKTFVIFNPSELQPLLKTLIYEEVSGPSPRGLSRQVEAIKCFIPVAAQLISIGMNKHAASKFVEDVLIEMGWEEISLQQITLNLFP